MLTSFWLPLLSGVAFLLIGWGMTKVDAGLPAWSPYVAFAVATILLLLTLWLAWQGQTRGRYRLSEGQARIIADALRGQDWQPATVLIRYKSNCEECRAFAQQLADTLTGVGWRGDIDITLDERKDLNGIHFLTESLTTKPASGQAVAAAFRQAGLPFQWTVAEPPLGGRMILFVYPKA